MASRSLFEGGGQASFDGWVLVEATGRHRERFLSSQVTCDVVGLAPGESHLAALLDSRGRLQSFFFLAKECDRMRLLAPEEVAAATIDQLESRIIADDVQLTVVPTGAMRLALGPESVALRGRLPEHTVFPLEAWGERGFVWWGGHQLPLPELDPELLEALRVVTGLPRWGVEVRRGMLVTETTLLETAVSRDKGCYLGQETVAKVRSGRGPAYAPVLLRVRTALDEPDHLRGRTFAVRGRKGGVVLSLTRWQGELYLQASLYRDLRVDGSALECDVGELGTVAVEVVSLPLVRADPPRQTAERLLRHGVDLFTSDREDEAMAVLERAIAVCPDFADAYESLGVIHGRRGEYQRAVSLMHRLLEIDPGSVMAHTNLSLYYNQQGKIEEAEREARQAALASARRRQAEAERAHAEEQARADRAAELERREHMFHQVLELDPDDALANFGMGELLVETGRVEEAAEHLDRALAADPSYSAAYLALGRAWHGMRQLDRARLVWQRGVEVAAQRGDLMTVRRMQECLAQLSGDAPS